MGTRSGSGEKHRGASRAPRNDDFARSYAPGIVGALVAFLRRPRFRRALPAAFLRPAFLRVPFLRRAFLRPPFLRPARFFLAGIVPYHLSELGSPHLHGSPGPAPAASILEAPTTRVTRLAASSLCGPERRAAMRRFQSTSQDRSSEKITSTENRTFHDFSRYPSRQIRVPRCANATLRSPRARRRTATAPRADALTVNLKKHALERRIRAPERETRRRNAMPSACVRSRAPVLEPERATREASEVHGSQLVATSIRCLC